MVFKFLKNSSNNQKGDISILLALMLMTVIFALAMGLSAVMFEEIRMIRRVERSVVAFYSADTGIEKGLKERRTPGIYTGVLNPGEPKYRQIRYKVEVFGWPPRRREPGELHCIGTFIFCLASEGRFMGTTRSVELMGVTPP